MYYRFNNIQFLYICILILINLLIVLWSVERLPIIIGGNVTLFCNTTSVNDTKVTWMKESDVIVHHGFVFYSSKYSEYSTLNGSFLTIIHTDINDINVSYTCISDVFSYNAKLKLKQANYIGNIR